MPLSRRRSFGQPPESARWHDSADKHERMSTKNFNCGAYLAPIVSMLHQKLLGTSLYDT